MIWVIVVLTWAIVTAGSHFLMGQAWKFTKVWAILSGITLILSLTLYYFLGRPNLPDHPHKEVIGLFNSKNA